MSPEPLEVKSLDGLTLEAALDSDDDPRAALALCHPHPKMGGTMNAPLLLALTEELAGRGWAVLRFNFRGIGASEGEPSTGRAEVADARGALAELRKRYPSLPDAIAGWSFGAAVAVRVAAADPSLAACVAIAPAVEAKPDVTEGLPAPDEIEVRVPILIVCAANDHLVDLDDAKAWSARVPTSSIEVLAGANHFFWGKYDNLAATAADFLDERVVL
jgi:alpha/beta superfamily hydrolase